MNRHRARETILFLSAANTNGPDKVLRGDREIQQIRQELERSRERDHFDLHERHAVRVRDLSQALLDLEPTILHFSGHAQSGDALVLDSDTGFPQILPAAALAEFLAPFAGHLRCVFLNACATEGLRSAIEPHVQAFLSMRAAISDDAAIAFSVGFYQAIGAGRSLETAVKLGRAQIHAIRPSERDIPQLSPEAFGEPATPQPHGHQPLTKRAQVGCRLPARLNDFSGRRTELDDLQQILTTGRRRVTISGMGGAGKTQLAIESAHGLATCFADGVLFLDLLGMRAHPLDVDEIAERVVHAFDPLARAGSRTSWTDLYHQHLTGRQCLLILDNAKDQSTLKPLVPPDSVAFIVTARRRLRLPGSEARDIGRMLDADALILMRAILGQVEASDTQLEALVAACGGLPLALRAAATNIVVYKTPVWEYLEQLQQARQDHRRLAFVSQTRDIDEDLDVRAVLLLSLDRLLEEDRTLADHFVDLADVPGEFAVGEAIASWDVDQAEARRSLEKLVARSLIERDQHSGRFRLHDLLRDLAESALVE